MLELVREPRSAIADGPGSPSWRGGPDRGLWLEEQGLLMLVLAVAARDDVTRWRVDRALGLPVPSSPPGASEPPVAP